MRSLVSSSLATSHYHPAAAAQSPRVGSLPHGVRDLLHAMDERSASDVPWWVVPDTTATDASSSEDGPGADDGVNKHKHASPGTTTASLSLSSSNKNAGYLIGALIAGIQKPLATAAVVMGIVSLSFPLSKNVGHFFNWQSDSESRHDDQDDDSSAAESDDEDDDDDS